MPAQQQADASGGQWLQSLAAALSLPLFIVGLDDTLLASNAAADRLLERGDGIPADARFKDLPLSYRALGLRAAIERVKAGGDGARLDEQQLPTAGGERAIVFEVTPVQLGDRRMGVAVVAHDRGEVRALRAQLDLVSDDLQAGAEQMEVTNEELRITNEQLHVANTQLEAQIEELRSAQEAIRHKDEFLAMLAHELRNPLAPILTAAHLLDARAHDPAAVKRAAETIHRQARHEARLLDDLLDVSRITRGMIELQRRPVEVAEVVDQAVEGARHLVDERRHTLSIVHAPEPIHVDADPVRLAQTVGNLLVNAAKFTPPGGRIDLRIERDDDTVVMRVSDSGVGIPADMLDKVFGLFTQVQPSLARSQGGLGIGLTLVKKLVEMHGGTVSAVSPGPLGGSEFVVRLPVGAAVARPAGRGARRPPPSWRVLIVEDHPDARAMLGEALQAAGHEVLLAEDGARGLETALAHRPQVAIVDIGLPDMSGYEVARQLRAALGAGVRLIALTGYGQADDRRRTLAVGFDAHVVKPVTIEQLELAMTDGHAGA